MEISAYLELNQFYELQNSVEEGAFTKVVISFQWGEQFKWKYSEFCQLEDT